MRSVRFVSSLVVSLAAAMLLGSCAKPVTCGTGTTLNASTSQCEVVPDFNIIVDDFNVGEFAFKNVDVPEQMQPGYPTPRTFTIKNTGDTNQEVVYVRIGIVPVRTNIEELRGEIENISKPVECRTDADCSVSNVCNPSTRQCRLNVTWASAMIIENLKAGEERAISHEMTLPLGWEKNGVYGALFSVNEVPLVKGDDGTYRVNPEGKVEAGTDRLSSAGALYAPSTILIGVPTKPNLRVLYATVDTPAFEPSLVLDESPPIMTMSSRLSAQGLDVTKPVEVRFELALPGHVVQTPGQDLGEAYFTERRLDFAAAPATTTWVYDANRKFALKMGTPDGQQAKVTLEPRCVERDANQTCTRELTIENEVGADLVGPLYLAPADVRTLYGTLLHRAQNPGLNADDEVAGKVRIIVSTTEPEYEVGGAPLLSDNVIENNVVFMAPRPAGTASPTDSATPPDTGTQADLVPCCGPYPESDDFTPQRTGSFGGEWLGANYQLKNTSNKRRQFGAVVATRFEADNFARVNVIKNQFDVVVAQGLIDFGTRRTLPDNRSSGIFRLMGTSYLDWSYSPMNCQTEDGVQTCMIVEITKGEKEEKGKPKPATTHKSKKKTVAWSYEKKKMFTIGPVPFEIRGSVGASLGWVAGLAFFRDTGDDPQVGVQFGIGPVATIGVTAFGGLSIGIARAGVEGSASLVEAEFKPTLKLGWAQKMDEANNCWVNNNGRLTFEGNLDLKILTGRIAVVAYAGVRGCKAWICVNWEKKVLDYTICSFTAGKESLPIWSKTLDLGGGGGICGAPPPTLWTVPRVSPGFSLYGSNANGTGAYQQVWPIPAGKCIELKVNGDAESGFDFLNFFDTSNARLAQSTGSKTNEVRRFCNGGPITTRFTSDASVERTGYSVGYTVVNP